MRTEDGYIIYKCLNGEPEAFGFLVDKYKASIYAFAYTKLRDFRDAEDVTQDVLIKAYQKLNTLKRWDSVLSWLYAITNNQCKNLMRSQHKRPDREFIEDRDTADLVKPSMDSHRESMALESIREALDLLPDIYSQVLTLHYFGGMTCKEIATFLRTSPGAVKKRLSRARSQLREEILAMMSTTYSRQKLGTAFTFRMVEIVKRIKISPAPNTRWLPWGLSLGTGIVLTVLSFFPQLFPSINITADSLAPSLPGEVRVSDTGEIPIDILKTSEIPFLASQQGANGEGVNTPDPQNAIFLAPRAEGDKWTQKADMPTGRHGLSTAVVNGKIYAMGGSADGVTSLPTLEEYDPSTDKWAKMADMPTPRFCPSTSVVNGKIYIMGGQGQGSTVVSIVEEYDPATDKWTRKADMPTARVGLSASAVNGKIYAIGGASAWSGPFLSAVEEYDPVKDEWTKMTDMPTPRIYLSTSVLNGKIYAIGGTHQMNAANNYNALPTVEEYDPVKDKWAKMADMPVARCGCFASVVNGRIYLAGGGDRQAFNPTLEEYDPATGIWTQKADMLTPRVWASASVVNGKIYVIGGSSGATGGSTVEEYTPEDLGQQGSVSPTGKLPAKWGKLRTEFASTRLPD